jgi:hypothetical protein
VSGWLTLVAAVATGRTSPSASLPRSNRARRDAPPSFRGNPLISPGGTSCAKSTGGRAHRKPCACLQCDAWQCASPEGAASYLSSDPCPRGEGPREFNRRVGTSNGTVLYRVNSRHPKKVSFAPTSGEGAADPFARASQAMEVRGMRGGRGNEARARNGSTNSAIAVPR